MKEIGPYLLPISAVISVFCFPPFPFGALIFVALVPFLLSIEHLGPARAFKYGFLWGLIFYFGLVYYIAWVTIPGMIATVLILSLIPATAGWFFVKLMVRSKGTALVFLPSYFIMWNWLFTMSDLNYPWTDIAYALSYYTTLIQAAEIGGVYLISLFIFAVNMLIYASVSEKFTLSGNSRKNLRAISIVLILILYVYGSIRLWNTSDGRADGELTVGILQGNITRDVKWKPGNVQISFDKYFELSREAAGYAPDLIIWPETAIPEYLMQRKRYKDMMRSFVDSLNVPVLTGIPYYEAIDKDEYIFYNTAAFLKPKIDDEDVYFKIHLVPVSERIPFRGKIKILREIRLGQADWSQGEDMKVFELNGHKFAAVICFESVFPGFCRQFAQRGAQFLVVITNDMWFGRTSLLEQHAMMSVFRAIENRIPVVRSANTGISMAIDKWGRIKAKSDIFVEDFLIADIRPEMSDSVYGSIGDIIPRTLTILSLISMAVAFLTRRRYNTEEL